VPIARIHPPAGQYADIGRRRAINWPPFIAGPAAADSVARRRGARARGQPPAQSWRLLLPAAGSLQARPQQSGFSDFSWLLHFLQLTPRRRRFIDASAYSHDSGLPRFRANKSQSSGDHARRVISRPLVMPRVSRTRRCSKELQPPNSRQRKKPVAGIAPRQISTTSSLRRFASRPS